MREQTDYNKVVSTNEYGDITILRDAFKYSDSFKGLTGSTFRLVSKKELKDRTTLKAITEKLQDSININEVPEQYKYTPSGLISKNPYKKWAQDIKNNGEEEDFMFDTSYRYSLWGVLDEFLGIKNGFYDWIGGGRCFDKDSVFNHAPELQYLINEYEN